MTTETLPHPADAGTRDEDWVHYFCHCAPDVAICGADVSGAEEACGELPGEPCQLCVVVYEANALVCARCGQ